MIPPLPLRYPNKSHRKAVHIPKFSVQLAEFFGIMIGDGGINNPWQANITLNSVKDFEYSLYVKGLIGFLFRITPTSFVPKTKNAIRILINGTSIVEFLTSNGLCRGDKLKQGLRIPDWILGKEEYMHACVRGLIDTDGCMYVHKHSVAGKRYENIGLTFTSYSPELLDQVAAIFEQFGIIPHIDGKGTSIYLYSAKAVERYLEIFGSSNDRIWAVYKNWKRG